MKFYLLNNKIHEKFVRDVKIARTSVSETKEKNHSNKMPDHHNEI